MNTEGKKSPGGLPHSSPELLKKELDQLLGELAVKLLGDRQRQQTMLSVAGTVMSTWSAGHPLKKIISRLVIKTMPALPPGQDSSLTEIAAAMGRIMVLHWMLRTHEIKENPTKVAENQSAFVKAFLDSIDLSQWKTMLEESKAGRIDATRRLNEILPEYQGKFLVILSALPTVISLAANSIKSWLEAQLKVLPPEMIFEIFSGLNSRIDWKEVGLMLNDHYELARRIHIGSSLGGDGVIPALRTMAGDMLKGLVSEIDPQRYAEAVAGNAGNREAIKNAVSDMMRAFPEFTKKMIAAAASSQTARLRGVKNRLQVLADLPDNDLNDVVNEFTGALDWLELADLISLTAKITNTAYETDPERLPETASAVVASVDVEEVRTLAENDLIRDLFKAVKPLATILMPPLIHGLCDLLTPEHGESNEELRAALDRLTGFLGDSYVNR